MIKGLDIILKNLKNEINRIEVQSLEGLSDASVDIIEDTDKSTPVIPVDTGNLRESRFVVRSDGITEYGENPKFTDIGRDGEVKADPVSMHGLHAEAIGDATMKAEQAGKIATALGFSAYYAAKVHEGVGIGKYYRPGSGAKFFESSIQSKSKTVIKRIANKIKIK